MNIPSTLQAGDSASWRDESWTDASGNPFAPSTHGLIYEIRGPATLTLTGVTSGNGWTFAITTDQSVGLSAGRYVWAAYHTATGIRVTRATGTLTVTANLAVQSPGYDPRSDAERALAACEQAIATGASLVRYQIGDRIVQKSGTAEILQAISYWRSVVAKEQSTAAIAAGLGNPRRLLVKFR